MKADKILLIQPRHIYAPPVTEEVLGHVYMPTSLLTIAAILNELEVETEIVDENINTVRYDHNIIGLNLLGAPYIPSAMRFEKKLFDTFRNDFQLLIGGQVASGLTDTDFINLFSEQTMNGNSNETICNVFHKVDFKIPAKEKISLIPIYEKIGDHFLKQYLSTEFSFYLSQGCKFSCSFCGADRSSVYSGKIAANENYREIDIALADFEYLLKKASEFKIDKLRVYLSNLDLFQTPLKLFEFASGVLDIKNRYRNIGVEIRGLSTSSSFLKAHKKYPYVIEQMINAGIVQIGFGIDGATAKVYKKTRKPQTIQQSLDVIDICHKIYGIIPEILMVFGHNNLEDEEALSLAVKFCKDMQVKYLAVPRPHIAKDMIPGNDGWLHPKNTKKLFEFYKNPMLFQNLDFTATPSQITHPNSIFREMVTKYYIKVCELPGSLTQYVLPELPTMTDDELQNTRLFNMKRYDI